MAYIGQSPSIGNFQVCDAISVVNGQAAYTMQVSSVNVVPETANHMLVSLNGILQRPGSSFTVSGSTITFASNLVTGDVINFIHILGSVLDLGVPSDDTVTAAKISSNAVTGAKLNTDVISAQTALATEPADTDEFLVSDAGVLKRIDYSLIKGGGGLVLLSHTTISSSTANAAFTSGIDSTYDAYKFVLSGVRPVTDDVDFHVLFSVDGGSSYLGGDYKYSVTSRDSGGNVEDGSSDSASFILLTGDDVGNESDESFNAEMVLYHPSNTAFHKQIAFQGVYYDHATLPNYLLGMGANSGSVAAVTGIKFQFASGNIAEGSFTMYGIAKA
jgi:hypothetical protein